MIAFEDYKTAIYIRLEPGIWVFDSETVGKTRLCKCLRDLEVEGYPVCGYTFEDLELGRKLSDILADKKYKLIMLDRYDLYSDMEHEAICKAAEYAIVLIDCKAGFKGSCNDEPCYINMTRNSIEVTE